MAYLGQIINKQLKCSMMSSHVEVRAECYGSPGEAPHPAPENPCERQGGLGRDCWKSPRRMSISSAMKQLPNSTELYKNIFFII